MEGYVASRWRRLDADRRREQILDCAVRLFGQRPYAAVSTTEIARQAGVARGLLNHYFGTKRHLYLEAVRRMVALPDLARALPTDGSLHSRVEKSVAHFLDAVTEPGATFAVRPDGVGTDPEVDRILAAADDAAAARVLDDLGVGDDERRQEYLALIRAYGAMAKAAVREWVDREALSREQVEMLLSLALLAVVRDVLPQIDADGH